MRTKVGVALPEVALGRILDALGEELINASDGELVQTAHELGMDLKMKGSAAYAGLIFPAKWQASDFFDLDALKQQLEQGGARATPGAISRDLAPKWPKAIKASPPAEVRTKSADALRKQVHSYLTGLTPREAKVLRDRFGIDFGNQSEDEEEGSLRAAARELVKLMKKTK